MGMITISRRNDLSHCLAGCAGLILHYTINRIIMDIYISEDATIANIQNEFQAAYPFLKLEFYWQPHEAGSASPAWEKIAPQTPIEDIRMVHSFGWISISHSRTAQELEYDFRHNYGLNVQVLRKSGDLWLETTKTDNWTLGQLNDEGKMAEKHIFFYPEEPIED